MDMPHLLMAAKKCAPIAIVEIRTDQGKVVYSRDKDEPKGQEQIFDVKHIAMLNQMLGKVVTGGTGRRANLDFTVSAGKTGTGQGYKDAFFPWIYRKVSLLAFGLVMTIADQLTGLQGVVYQPRLGTIIWLKRIAL